MTESIMSTHRRDSNRVVAGGGAIKSIDALVVGGSLNPRFSEDAMKIEVKTVTHTILPLLFLLGMIAWVIYERV